MSSSFFLQCLTTLKTIRVSKSIVFIELPIRNLSIWIVIGLDLRKRATPPPQSDIQIKPGKRRQTWTHFVTSSSSCIGAAMWVRTRHNNRRQQQKRKILYDTYYKRLRAFKRFIYLFISLEIARGVKLQGFSPRSFHTSVRNQSDDD